MNPVDAFGKTQAGPLGPRLRAQRGRSLQPRRARSHRDTPPEDWLHIPVPPLVGAVVFATVQEQLEENRRHARQGLRGARYLLQVLVCCAQCGYAFYGKAISPSKRRGRPRSYAYYRCIGTDAYRFGGERCATTTRSAPTCWTPLFGARPALFWSSRTSGTGISLETDSHR